MMKQSRSSATKVFSTLTYCCLLLMVMTGCAATVNQTPASPGTPSSSEPQVPPCCYPFLIQQLAANNEKTEAKPDPRPTRTNTVSLINEIDMGDNYSKELAKEFLVESDERLEKIFNKVVVFADRPVLSYEIHKLSGMDQANAFSIPGGRIYITNQFLERLQPTDGELAFIIGHEIAHAALRHLPTAMELDYADYYSRMTICSAAYDGVIDPFTAEVTFETLDLSIVIMNFNREFEADQFGALYAMQAGYKYSEAISALEKLESRLGSTSEIGTTPSEVNEKLPNEIPSLPTHPPVGQRIEQLLIFQNQLAEMVERTDSAIDILNQGNFEEASLAFTNALKIFPESKALSMNIALAKHMQYRASLGEEHNFLGTLTNAKKLEIKWQEMASRGSAKNPGTDGPDMEAFTSAIDGYKSILSLDPEHYLTRNNLAVAFLDKNDFDGAIEQLERTLTIGGNGEITLKNLAIAYVEKIKTLDPNVDTAEYQKIATATILNWDQFNAVHEGDLTDDEHALHLFILKLKDE